MPGRRAQRRSVARGMRSTRRKALSSRCLYGAWMGTGAGRRKRAIQGRSRSAVRATSDTRAVFSRPSSSFIHALNQQKTGGIFPVTFAFASSFSCTMPARDDLPAPHGAWIASVSGVLVSGWWMSPAMASA